MKFFIPGGLFLLISSFTFGQTVVVSGTVNNEGGQPVPYAFVRDVQHNYATYADSTGTFMLNADPASSLQIMAGNYKNTTIKLDNKTNVKVVLPAGTAAEGVVPLNSSDPNASARTPFITNRQLFITRNAVNAGGAGFGGSDVTIVKEGFNVEPTRGSRYLYDDWMPGFGISKKDSLVVETTNMYNYDKLNGNIMYTNDGKSMASVSIQQIKSFSLYDKKGHAHVYENAPLINGKPFVEVLLATPRYKIYKKVDTKLNRADFHTDGVLEMGHKYDEYVDIDRYYFVGADSKPQSISLKKTTLKKLLAGDADVFIASQGSRDVDEDYVRDLGSSLSK
ncbi:hypothetical protein [Mucilaginibacter sp.]|uniref:hypothetical protein n=1 Tax=Mucilaginibacter sp. TaxID=1882438 RepID=UPI0026364FA7|nr:hypothetical protein [Mucilaginibacter sp.]MDB4918418.1 hypothetical protein [Mucilaginibacter sp.]